MVCCFTPASSCGYMVKYEEKREMLAGFRGLNDLRRRNCNVMEI